MKLQGSDVTEVTQLALYWQKAGEPVAKLPSNQSPHQLREDFAELGLLWVGGTLLVPEVWEEFPEGANLG